MLQKLISRFILPKHYWRDLGFNELSEIYTSMMFRSLAWNLVGIFIPIYLFQLDYEIWQVFFFYATMFSIWTLATYPAARLIAKVGPKHTILASYVFQTISMLMLVSLEELRWPLPAIAVILGISSCLFFLALHVDFSKVKHREHGGKELGWLYSMERIGAVLGPLVGGLVAFLIGAEYIFAIAVALLFVGLIPLFLTNEPTAVNQKLKFKELKVHKIRFDIVSYGFFYIEHVSGVIIWPLFIGIYVFSDNPYIQLGSIASISVLISLFIARAIGKTIDKNRGRSLLRAGAVLNAVLYLFRPFTNGYPYALGVNMANEAIHPTFRMAYLKGMYDAADDLPGKRIVYLTALETTGALTKAVFFLALGFVALMFGDSKSMFIGIFAIGAVASLGIMLERFKALDVKP